eukprot:453752-Rhodomonas_salina.2
MLCEITDKKPQTEYKKFQECGFLVFDFGAYLGGEGKRGRLAKRILHAERRRGASERGRERERGGTTGSVTAALSLEKERYSKSD